jgi:3'-phosphoadenosine 5'-phosphosulfate sulfotransferase (PAPS reductase)/FAD synthetase
MTVIVDPFHVTGPAVVSLSGGRTSAFLLHEILQAHGGTLPADVVVCFCNTGREMPATLDFVRDCAAAWGVDVVWLEYRREVRPGQRARIYSERVNHNSASRAGEPFDALLVGKGLVPDPFRRFCTEELKVSTVKRYVVEVLGWKAWTNIVGLRADETARLEKRHRAEASETWHSPWRSSFPLFDAGKTVLDVRRFWQASTFDLRLLDAVEGNCDGCFMKSSADLGVMFRRYPERMRWWTEKEAACLKHMVHNRSYDEVQRVAERQGVLAWDDAQPCDEGCGL